MMSKLKHKMHKTKYYNYSNKKLRMKDKEKKKNQNHKIILCYVLQV